MGEIASLEEMIRTHGRERPDAPMADYDGDRITYGKMDRRSNRIANAMVAEGIAAGDRIALIDRNGLPLFETLFAARKLGAVQIAVNWRQSTEEMAYVLADGEARLVFTAAEFLSGLREHCAQHGLTPRFVVLDGPDEEYRTWYERFPDSDPGHQSGPDDVALQLYTSGTTGRPKGAMLMNRSIFSFYESAADTFGRDPAARHLNCLPLFHVGGINWSLHAMNYGSEVIGFRDFDPVTIINAIPAFRATHLMTVPAVIQILLETPEVRQGDFSSLRAICYGGSIIPAHVLRDAAETFGCGLYGMYGSTELSFGNTVLWPEEHDFEKFPDLVTSCGRAFPGTRIKVVDPATLEQQPDGESGEIWVNSPQAAKGYWKRLEESAGIFRADGWFRTGDIGMLRGGYLYLTDRLNDMIISGAENIYPAEVERVLNEHPAVLEAAAFAIPDPKWGETVAAAVRTEPGTSLDEAALIAFSRERLAHYKCPRKILFLDEFPRTASGKVQRNLLKKPFWETA